MIVVSSAGATAQSAVTPPPVKQTEITQKGSVIHLAVNGDRPLVTALDALQNKYGWNVNYEDPQFVSKADLTDSVDPRYTNSVAGTKARTPNGGALAVDFAADGSNAAPDEAKTLQALVDAYNKSANPGQFELRPQAHGFDVVGIAAHDDTGKRQKQNAPLDATVTISDQQVPAIDAVTSICDQVSKLTQQTISLGVFPRTLLSRPIRTDTAAKIAAREALSQVFSKALPASSKSISWRLLYDPDSKCYVLNLHLHK